jgi:acetolactate synthase-1/2/3 large subunit
MESLPDFVKLAEAFQCVGLRATQMSELDDVIKEMLSTDKPVVADILVDQKENCFPMIPSGTAHYEMILGDEAGKPGEQKVSEDGMVLV